MAKADDEDTSKLNAHRRVFGCALTKNLQHNKLLDGQNPHNTPERDLRQIKVPITL